MNIRRTWQIIHAGDTQPRQSTQESGQPHSLVLQSGTQTQQAKEQPTRAHCRLDGLAQQIKRPTGPGTNQDGNEIYQPIKTAF